MCVSVCVCVCVCVRFSDTVMYESEVWYMRLCDAVCIWGGCYTSFEIWSHGLCLSDTLDHLLYSLNMLLVDSLCCTNSGSVKHLLFIDYREQAPQKFAVRTENSV